MTTTPITPRRGAVVPTSASSDAAEPGAVPVSDLAPDVQAALDDAVGAVADKALNWARTGAAARADLLDRVLVDVLAASDDWLAAACAAKGLAPGSPEAGEELSSGVGTLVTVARALRDALRDIARDGRPSFAGPVGEAADGRLRVRVYPESVLDRLVFPQVTAEVWMQPGVTRDNLEAGQARAYADPLAGQGVALVLAAGNVASLGPRDVLSKLFVEGQVVVMKANPVNDYLMPHWQRALGPLVDEGVLRIVDGGPEVGRYLTAHPLIDTVHVTGSDKTYDAIVFGTGEEGARRKAADHPALDKPVSAELGNVSPVIVVPGRWTAAELQYQAEHVATMLVNNAGFNCLAARVIVTHESWPQRDAFLGALTQVLAARGTRRAYYPGAAARCAAFVDAHPEAEKLGHGPDDALPWTFIRGVPAGRTDDICFNVESFCGECAETALPAPSTADFVDAAVRFCNDVLWGSLSVTVLVDPRTRREPEVAEAVDRAVADLRYGAIGVNVWHALAFAFGVTTWGAYPGHARNDIQSGCGVVGNAAMFDRPQKSVVEGPFVARPKPQWFAGAGSLPVMRQVVAFQAAPSAARVPRLMLAALRGARRTRAGVAAT
jgi:acyl-CoA reductase-like NAD-dependent aldehyde dehydrogenase